MEEIKKQIEEYAEISAREGVENITSNKQHITPKTLHIALKMSIKLGTSFVLSKWQDSERWRKVEEETPEVKNEPYYILVKDEVTDTIDVHIVYPKTDFRYLRDYTHWKPIH